MVFVNDRAEPASAWPTRVQTRVRSLRRFLERGDELVGLVTGELAVGLALREAHRAACVSEVRVPCCVQQLGQLTHLAL